jgi:hypothetical protein
MIYEALGDYVVVSLCDMQVAPGEAQEGEAWIAPRVGLVKSLGGQVKTITEGDRVIFDIRGALNMGNGDLAIGSSSLIGRALLRTELREAIYDELDGLVETLVDFSAAELAEIAKSSRDSHGSGDFEVDKNKLIMTLATGVAILERCSPPAGGEAP